MKNVNRFVNFILIINFAQRMEIIFSKEYLKELHLTGKTSDKHHRFRPDIIKRYQKTINRMAYAGKPEDLMRINSLNYEKLKGDKSGLSSVRVSDKYRIEFEERCVKEEHVFYICNIIELSNHYK